jgi:dTMP kinase
MSSKGKFITFEGGEGVGKTTQAKIFAQRLSEAGEKVFIAREPGGDEIGERIRGILKSSKGIDPVCELLLLFAARRDNFIKIISPRISEGYFVICDRFYDSTLVYQGILKGVSVEDIMRLKRISIGDFEPDLTLVLDLDADVSMGRVTERNLIGDEYDQMSRQKHELVRDGFRKIADIFSFRAILINANGSERTVASRIWKAFDAKSGALDFFRNRLYPGIF